MARHSRCRSNSSREKCKSSHEECVHSPAIRPAESARWKADRCQLPRGICGAALLSGCAGTYFRQLLLVNDNYVKALSKIYFASRRLLRGDDLESVFLDSGADLPFLNEVLWHFGQESRWPLKYFTITC